MPGGDEYPSGGKASLSHEATSHFFCSPRQDRAVRCLSVGDYKKCVIWYFILPIFAELDNLNTIYLIEDTLTNQLTTDAAFITSISSILEMHKSLLFFVPVIRPTIILSGVHVGPKSSHEAFVA